MPVDSAASLDVFCNLLLTFCKQQARRAICLASILTLMGAVSLHSSPDSDSCVDSVRQAYGKLAGWQSSRSWRDGQETYAGMVEVSRALMKASITLCTTSSYI